MKTLVHHCRGAAQAEITVDSAGDAAPSSAARAVDLTKTYGKGRRFSSSAPVDCMAKSFAPTRFSRRADNPLLPSAK
jgi:hypothetical protein